MPIKLLPPRPGKTPFYAGRGKHLGVYVDRSTRASNIRLARKIIRQWEVEIECGRFTLPGDPTFASAALSYMQAGGQRRPLVPVLQHFGDLPLKSIDQAAIDACAAALMPTQSAATRNREVYTPISAVLKHSGLEFEIKRPKGSRGNINREWLRPEAARRVIDAAYRVEPEIGLLCIMLLYGGLRISEQLAMLCDNVDLAEAEGTVPTSKNGEPQTVYLTPYMVEALSAHPRGLDRPGERLFRYHRGGGLNWKLIQACMVASGHRMPQRLGRGSPWPSLPEYEFEWVTWHTFRRTYATWMRRYGGLDDKDLVDTGRWKTLESASRYAQTVVNEAARKADLLPVPAIKRSA